MNPVLINDMRKSLFRRKPVLAVLYMAIAVLVLVFGVMLLLPGVGSWQMRQYPFWRGPDFLLPFLAPMFAAGAFAKEHEQRTWQDVLLTRLSGGEILRGKFFACFVPTLVALVVLMPALALLLIIQGMDWAMEPGGWMLLWGLKLIITATFFVLAGLVVSYHSPNARVALVITYCSLVFYLLLNYFFWAFVLQPMLMPSNNDFEYYRSTAYQLSYQDPRVFSLSGLDWLALLQAAFLSLGMMGYLALRLRQRTQ